MATTQFGVNHPLAVKLWSKKLFYETLKATWVGKFIGGTSSSLIQKLTDTQKGAGDKITVGLRMLLTGDGIQGDGTLEGNEEALNFYNDAVVINQLRHAVRSDGKMSEQRVPYSVREEARQALTDWYADRIDTAFFNAIAGNTTQSDTKYTGNNGTTAPDSNHWLYSTGNGEATLSASSVFSLTMIDRAVVKAKTLSPGIRPLKVNGEDKFVVFIHPYQHYQLRTNTNTAQYMDIQKAAVQGGQIGKNPIYTGAIAEYNGCVIHESTRVPWGHTSQDANSKTTIGVTSVARAVLCGAQAGVLAFGQNTSSETAVKWVEDLFDKVKTLVALGRNTYRKACELGGTLNNQTIPSYA